ncbi:MAG: hypothetical protein ABI047_12960 [Jatrophihabitantaceae bacterium]
MPRTPRYAPQHRPLSRLGSIGAALAAVLLLSGCFAIGVKAKVHSDDTVSGTARFGVSKSLAALAGGASTGLFGQAGQPCRFGSRSFASKPFDDGAYTGVECSFDGLSLADFNAGMQGPRLQHSGGQFRLSGSFDLAATMRDQTGQLSGSASGTAGPPTALPTDLASLLPTDLASLLPTDLASLLPSDLASLLPTDLAGPLPSGLPQLDPSALLKSSKVSFEFSFPGRVLSSKGTVRGNTVSFAPDAAGRIEFETIAEADPGAGAGIGPAGWASLAALLVAVAALVGWLVRRRSRPVAASPAGYSDFAHFDGPAQSGGPAQFGGPAQSGGSAQSGGPDQIGGPDRFGGPDQSGRPAQSGGPDQFSGPAGAGSASASNPLPGFGPFYGPDDGPPDTPDAPRR